MTMHSHQQHRDKGRKRVAHVLRSAGYTHGGHAPCKKRGGGVMHHGRARGNDTEVDLHADGHKGKHRYARGGKAKHQVNIAVVVPHHPAAPGAGPSIAPVPHPPMGGPATVPMAPPMAAAPTLNGQPGMPPCKRGGRIKKDYGPSEAVPEDISEYRAAKNQGGPTSSYGSATGMSRKAEYERMKREGH
jgi:hypothetical protein